MSSFRRRLMMAQGGGGSSVPGVKESEAGDICVYDVNKGSLAIIKSAEWSASKYPIATYVPIGIVVVPASHGHYKDGKCAVMSLLNMSSTTPDVGSIEYENLPGYGEDSSSILQPLLNNYDSVCFVGDGVVGENVIGVSEYCYLPSDYFNKIANPYDSNTYYDEYNEKYSPSPYKNDGSFNEEYAKIISPSSQSNCLADFDGYGNTNVMISNVLGQPNWKTDSTIQKSYEKGYFPAACCCWRFNTQGTKQGDWYLPSAGELGYVCARRDLIDKSIDKLSNRLSSNATIKVSFNAYVTSSHAYNKSNGFINMGSGYVNNRYISVFPCARAFLLV